MAVQIEVEVTGTVTADQEYQLAWEVVNHVDMPAEIFLHTSGTDRFDGVISPHQLAYPVTPEEGTGYYRKDNAVAQYPDQRTAFKARDNVNAAISDLATAYKDGLQEFLITETFEFPDDS